MVIDLDEAQQALYELFEKTLAEEYEDELLEELEENDQETRGKETLVDCLLAAVIEIDVMSATGAEDKLGNPLRWASSPQQDPGIAASHHMAALVAF